MKKVILGSLLLMSMSVFAEPSETVKADAQAVNEACKTEASTAGCGSDVVGKGLIKCIHKYKREHRKDFTISEGCKESMQKLHQDRMEKRAGKK